MVRSPFPIPFHIKCFNIVGQLRYPGPHHTADDTRIPGAQAMSRFSVNGGWTFSRIIESTAVLGIYRCTEYEDTRIERDTAACAVHCLLVKFYINYDFCSRTNTIIWRAILGSSCLLIRTKETTSLAGWVVRLYISSHEPQV